MPRKTAKSSAPARKTASKPRSAAKPMAVRSKLVHLEGCPENPDRIESYPVSLPTGGTVTVTRCNDCGAEAVAKSSRGEAQPSEADDGEEEHEA